MQKIFTLLTLLVSLSLMGLSNLSRTGLNPSGTANNQPLQPEVPLAENTVYLPLINKAKITPSLIGAEIHYSGLYPEMINKAKDANIKWARISAIKWIDIEPVRTNPPSYNWSAVNENHLIGVTNAGIKIMAIVRWAPQWAQKYPPYACGAIREDALDAFAQFMTEAVKRYSKLPYDIHYWEIGNEPDSPPLPGDPQGWFGCWGDMNDPLYFGGGYYAKMLEKVYPAIKAADPTAKVVIGGLLLDCDPTNPPPGKDCRSSNFLEGIFVNNGKYNGANYFDIVNYHALPGYDGTLLVDENFPAWAARGGLSLGKADFLREVMAKYGVSKPIFHSEGSLICPETNSVCQPTPGADFFEAQADYVVWLYVRDWADGIAMTSWYEFEGEGWRYDSLLDGNGQPKPSYNALKFLTNELSGASFQKQIFDYAPLRTYQFASLSKIIWVMWSPDGNTYPFSLPPGAMKVLDKYGNQVSVASNQIMIKSPVYIEIQP